MNPKELRDATLALTPEERARLAHDLLRSLDARAAERFAKRVRRSRSHLYAEAPAEFLSWHSADEVTEAMNKVVDQVSPPKDQHFTSEVTRRTIRRTEW